MTVVETVLVYVGIPACIYGLIALTTLVPSAVRRPRYRPGRPWTYEPVWWEGHPIGPSPHGVTERHTEATPVRTGSDASPAPAARGGARGHW